MPAPLSNTNAATHGLRLTVSRVPIGAEYVAKAVYKFRGLVERAVMNRHGEITVYWASLIQSACRWELHSRLASRWLKMAHDQLTAGEKLNYSREAARASSERDRCLKELSLDRADTADVFDALYNTPTASDSPAHGNGHQATHGDASQPIDGDGQDDSPDAESTPEEPQGAHAAVETEDSSNGD